MLFHTGASLCLRVLTLCFWDSRRPPATLSDSRWACPRIRGLSRGFYVVWALLLDDNTGYVSAVSTTFCRLSLTTLPLCGT